jgi:membrane protease YdiL (CAAX protease family)
MLGAIGVGFGEEMINRGTLLVGLRTKYSEGKVWFFSTFAFAALHLPNALFGASVGPTIGQFFFAFIVGSLLYSIRRLSGTLLLAMFLHGLWDSSIFLPGALNINPLAVSGIIYPISIICAVAVILKNKGKTVQKY